MKRWLLTLSLILPFAAAAQPPVERTVAVTFDDLPFAAVPAENNTALEDITDRKSVV